MTARSSLMGLRLYYFLGFVALGIYSPMFPRWLEANGIRGFELGLVAASSPVMGLLSPPLFGWIVDRTRWRTSIVALTAALATVTIALLAVLARREPPGFAVTLALVATFAFFRAPMVSLADTIVLEEGAAYGPLRLWGSIGFLLAAAIGARVLDPTSATMLFAIALAHGCAAIATVSLPKRASAPSRIAPRDLPRRPVGDVLRSDPALLLLLTCMLLLETAHSVYDLCYSLHLRDQGVAPAMAGVLWATGVAAEVGFFLRGERLLERFGAGWLLVVGCGSIAVRMTLLAEADALPMLVVVQLLHALTFGATWTALMRIVRDRSAPETMGTVRGIVSATSAIGGTAGMIAWGSSYRSLGGPATFRMAAALGAAACVFAVIYARRFGRGGAEAPLAIETASPRGYIQ